MRQKANPKIESWDHYSDETSYTLLCERTARALANLQVHQCQ